MSDNSLKLMHCMEVWGGNQPTDSGVIMPGLDAWIYSRPCQQESAGGDVHYVSSCASGQVARMLLADVAGHGTGVAKTAADLRSLMRRYVNDHNQIRFVRSLNREFTNATASGVFATAVAMTFDCPSNTLLICNAGHPPPLWYQSAKKKWNFLQPSRIGDANVPWGIVDDVDYEQFAVRLETNDLVLCYTDCLLEAKTPTGSMLGLDGLLNLVATLDNLAPSTCVSALLKVIETLAPGGLDCDDVTCLLFRPNGLRQRIPLRDRLLTIPRFFGHFLGLQFAWANPPKQLG